jgi:hypothetical protein
MAVPTTFADLSTTIGSNSPSGSDNVFPDLDNYIRALAGFVASISANSGNGWTSPYLTVASPSYTGTLTGGTGVVNIGSGQLYKDTSGNVGIGITSPVAKFHAYGAAKVGEGVASNTSKLMVNTISGVAAGVQLFQDANESWIIQNPASSTALTFGNSGTERMRIDSTGNVGIGAAPAGARRLEVYSSANQTDILVGSTSAGNVGLVARWDNASANGYVYTTSAVPLLFGTNSTERMRIDASGNVGIGVASPSVKLDVQGALGAVLGQFFENSSGSTRRIRFNISSNVATIESTAGVGSTNLAFAVDGAERMRIDASGNVGIGVTPSAWLSAAKALQIGAGASVSASGSSSTEHSCNAYMDSGGTWRYINSEQATQYVQDSSAGAHRWYSASGGTAGAAITFTLRLSISSGGVGIGTASPTVPLDVDGAVRTRATTVASLTNAILAGAGARHFVTDATATTFASAVAGGGSNSVPVYSDGLTWRIG